MLDVKQYHRKSFPVEAVQVTVENMVELAEWCKGAVRSEAVPDQPGVEQLYVKVRVENPMDERQTKAYVGDWVLYARRGYKVYKDRPFQKSFEDRGQVDLAGWDLNERRFLAEVPPSSIKTLNFDEGDNPADSAVVSSNAGTNPGGTHTV